MPVSNLNSRAAIGQLDAKVNSAEEHTTSKGAKLRKGKHYALTMLSQNGYGIRKQVRMVPELLDRPDSIVLWPSLLPPRAGWRFKEKIRIYDTYDTDDTHHG